MIEILDTHSHTIDTIKLPDTYDDGVSRLDLQIQNTDTEPIGLDYMVGDGTISLEDPPFLLQAGEKQKFSILFIPGGRKTDLDSILRVREI